MAVEKLFGFDGKWWQEGQTGKDCRSARSGFNEINGRHVGTRTPDFYRQVCSELFYKNLHGRECSFREGARMIPHPSARPPSLVKECFSIFGQPTHPQLAASVPEISPRSRSTIRPAS